MSDKHVCIIGAGPGGLTAAMLLSYRGYKVSLFERESSPGGRNRSLQLGDYRFDTGPTFLMMPFVLRQVFELAGRNADDYLKFINLDSLYVLNYLRGSLAVTTNRELMQQRIDALFANEQHGLAKFFKREKVRYEKMYPCLLKSYSSIFTFFSEPFIRAIPHLSLTKSLYSVLSNYFKSEELKISFSFQSKYLGMSPWECPGAFAIIPYIEHQYGILHTMGGLSSISEAMARVASENGAQIFYNTPVKRVAIDTKGNARGVVLESGERISADAVVIGADFGYAMGHLFDPGVIRKWSPEHLLKKRYSCSTFMLYLGVDKLYQEPHHQIIFAKDYKTNIESIVKYKRLPEDFSFYLRNASISDPTLAPQGHSAVYILVPVPNLKADMAWDESDTLELRELVLQKIKSRTTMSDLDSHIVQEKILTPKDWESSYHLFLGSTFNLGHNLNQMLYFRPHNRFEEVGRCYLVGGGTHPGSGLPTIYESARITTNLISRDLPY